MRLMVKSYVGAMLTFLTPSISNIRFEGKYYRFMGADRNDDGTFTVSLKALNTKTTLKVEAEPFNILKEDTLEISPHRRLAFD